jgi:hypothetical protein
MTTIKSTECYVITMNVDIKNVTFKWDDNFNQKQWDKIKTSYSKSEFNFQLNIEIEDLEYVSGERFNLNHIFDDYNRSLERDENSECEHHFVHDFIESVIIHTEIQGLILHAKGVEWDVKISMPPKDQWIKL